MIKILFIFLLAFNSCASGNNNVEQKQDTVQHINSEQSQTSLILKKETVDSIFLSYWQKFADVIKASNYSQLKEVSLDTLECEHTNIHIEAFIKNHIRKVFSDSVLLKIKDTTKIDFINAAMEPTSFSPSVKQQIKNSNYTIKEVNITTGKYPDVLITTFKFIETDKGYKFYGYDKFGG